LNLPLDKVSFIILKAREYDVKESDSDPNEGSNAIDDSQIDVLTDKQDDPVREELLGAIRSLNEDERMRLVALAWLGRGTYSKDEWRDAVATARSEHSRRTAEYLLSLPLGWKSYRDHERIAASAAAATAGSAEPTTTASAFAPVPSEPEDDRPTRLN